MEVLKTKSLKADASPSTSEIGSDSIVYLTLGDGDFTYSLDLARYMKLSLKSPLSSTKQKKNTKLILTGVDTLEALTSKYKDTPFILQDIRSQEDGMISLSSTIRHGVNAIVHPKDDANVPLHEPADHVLFHHPHLGTENCELHKRFLAHLFYSVDNHWMKRKGGIFHLTLVEGQFERWKCQAQAERHGLELLHKSPFSPPPVTKPNGTNNVNKSGVPAGNRYHFRRHQTGKSFGNRRPNSRSFTYTFGRTADKGMYIATTLPWQTAGSSDPTIGTEKCATVPSPNLGTPKPSMLMCPFCEKEFPEKRSLKCHLRDKHSCDKATLDQVINGGNQLGQKRKREMTLSSMENTGSLKFACQQCQPSRMFQSEKALQAHIQAKHSGIFTYIAPDWSKECQKIEVIQPVTDSQQEKDTNNASQCQICGFEVIDRDFSRHLEDFIPVDESQTFSCDFCSKSFREERAKLQHMNFCSKRCA